MYTRHANRRKLLKAGFVVELEGRNERFLEATNSDVLVHTGLVRVVIALSGLNTGVCRQSNLRGLRSGQRSTHCQC